MQGVAEDARQVVCRALAAGGLGRATNSRFRDLWFGSEDLRGRVVISARASALS